MQVTGISHLCFSVSDLERSVEFYREVFGAKLLVKGRSTAYFDLGGMWLALNEEKDVPRRGAGETYTHTAFSVNEDEFAETLLKLEELNVNILPGRERSEQDGRSVYFTDPDGHMFEFHTGTLEQRLDYYRRETPHMTFYE
ncbi:metallothiol transferase FosB [Alteribacter natronophilus]|uniref:metallothiol transferase FosB n=1 Tax=Alteribacter natronophilus TaxID=2583810 RepID=UPI00110E748F|nr:metallothiol transferase FosB [Alteribacter natronophilus]TMW70989.1 metallothiol transferase FosB [Alteribacter natronophilus]